MTTVRGIWYNMTMENKGNTNWGCISIFAFVLIVGGCSYGVATSEPDPYVKPNFGPSCVVTHSNGCTWAGQEVPKGSAADMIEQQKRTKTGLYAEK